MATTPDARTFSRALYETLIGVALDQLREAAPKLAGRNGADPEIERQVNAVLPANAFPEVRNFLLALAQENALDRLPEIVQAFEGYVQAGSQAVSAEVVSAVTLDDAQRDRIVSDLRQKYGTEVDVRFAVDESIIGGLVIRVGDQVLDNSLRTRLSEVQRGMLSS